MESIRVFRGKIYYWLKKVETVKVEVKPEFKDEPFLKLAQALVGETDH